MPYKPQIIPKKPITKPAKTKNSSGRHIRRTHTKQPIKRKVEVDTSFIEERKNLSRLHHAALEGNTGKIKQLVNQSHKNLNHIDSADESPLYYALRANQLAAFKTLLALGANLVLDSSTALDIRCLALYLKFNNCIDNEFYRYVKNTFGLNKETQASILKPIKQEMRQAKSEADKLGKKLLIILGEIHDSFAIYQVKKGIFKIAKKLGLSVGYAEKPNNINLYDPLRKKMKDKYGYSFHPVDIAREGADLTDRGFRYRETAMAKEIYRHDSSGVFVTGCVHMQGFFNRFKHSTQFQVLPINLAGLEKLEFDSSNERFHFLHDPEYIVQVTDTAMKGNYKNIRNKWSKV